MCPPIRSLPAYLPQGSGFPLQSFACSQNTLSVINPPIHPIPPADLKSPRRQKDFRFKVASKRGQRTRLRGLCRARATSLRSNNPSRAPTAHAPPLLTKLRI
ncbi:MAG: hypothetical protein LBQ31_05850 [Bacteroidales bacterium]|nr:hypothetical protein [Bacteroidales bacterium]